MVKLRDAGYCNLKLLLIFLVVYGHLIEPGIWQSEILMTQYKWIYFVHMPLFCFLSGLFLKDEKSCRMQIVRMLPLYLLCQALAVLLGDGKVLWKTPYWHLWYLLSYSFWLCFAWAWFRICRGRGKTTMLIVVIIVGCLAGLDSNIGRPYSLSRSLVFLPYFWAGLICDPGISWRKLRPVGVAALALALILFVRYGSKISAVFLYQAAPYGNIKTGPWLRLVCYLIGGCLSLFLLVFTPSRRFPFTKIGANTMPAYLIHAPIVLYLREKTLPWQMYLLIAIVFLYMTDLLLQWFGKLYGIVPREKGGITGDALSKSLRRIRPASIPLPVDPHRQ